MPNGGEYGSLKLGDGVRSAPHRGIDYAGHHGRAVIAAADGTVTMVQKEDAERNRIGPNVGRNVEIKHEAGLPDGSPQKFTQYVHLARIDVRSGHRVKRGQRIGTIGTTGCAHYQCAAHVHFEVHREFPADPEDSAKSIAGCHDPRDPPPFNRQKMLA